MNSYKQLSVNDTRFLVAYDLCQGNRDETMLPKGLFLLSLLLGKLIKGLGKKGGGLDSKCTKSLLLIKMGKCRGRFKNIIKGYQKCDSAVQNHNGT